MQDPIPYWIAKSRDLKLGEDPQWVNLLHFKRNIFGLKRSQVKGKEFFLHSEGYKDATLELEATLASALNTSTLKDLSEDHPVCKFPARVKWLQRKLGIPKESFSVPHCRLYDLYKKRLGANSMSVVFSSFYPDAPSSSFGHTLFKVNKAGGGPANELLDWGISYAATVDNPDALTYAVKGLTGGFKGEFSSMPYYMKVREYNDYESRDLWTYELDLSPSEVDFLLDHLWEVGDSYFDYYFLTQNCGLHMLTVLEAAVPRYKVFEKVPFWVMPSDALKAMVDDPKNVRRISWRPSIFAQFRSHVQDLSEQESAILKEMKQEGREVLDDKNISEARKARILDTYLLGFDMRSAKEIAAEDPEVLKTRHNILLRRSKLPVVEDVKLSIPWEEAPHASHGSARFTFWGGRSLEDPKEDFVRAQMRFALHDALDPMEGYPKFSTIEMFKFDAEKNKETLKLKEFQFLNLESLSVVTDLNRKRSWSLGLGWRRTEEPNCQDCAATEFKTGAGLAFELGVKDLLGFGFFNGRLQGGEDFRRGVNLVLEPGIGLLGYMGFFNFRLDLILKRSLLFDSRSWFSQRLMVQKNFDKKYHLQGQLIDEGGAKLLLLGGGVFF